MKKALVLVAGLFLATGTIFAEGKIDFSGSSIRYQQLIRNSEWGNQMYSDSDWGTDAVLKLNYAIDSNNSVSLKYSTDDDDEKDENGKDSLGSLTFKRVDGPIEAQFATEFSLSGNDEDIQEDKDSTDTYIKYNLKEDLSLTFYPYNMGTSIGAWFNDSKNNTEIPGVVLKKGNLNIGVGIDQASWPKENIYAIKAGYSFNLAGVYIKTEYSGSFFNEDKLSPLYTYEDKNYPDNNMLGDDSNTLGIVTQQADIYAYKKIGDKLALMGELAYNKLAENSLKLGDELVDSGAAAMFRAEYNLTSKLKPYAQVKYITDGFMGYWRQREFNAEGKTKYSDKYNLVSTTVNGKTVYSLDGVKTGGTTEYIIGAEYTLRNNLVATVEGQYVQAGEEVFHSFSTTSGNTNTEKTYYELTTGIAYYF